MPSCRNCGSSLPEGVHYCPKCGTAVEALKQPKLAFWGERFLALLVDVIILGIVMVPINLLALLWWSGYNVVPSLCF